jgi:hypothetical protein
MLPCVQWCTAPPWRGLTQEQAFECVLRMGFTRDDDLTKDMVKSALVPLAQYMHNCIGKPELAHRPEESVDEWRSRLVDSFSLLMQYFEMSEFPTPFRKASPSSAHHPLSPGKLPSLPLPQTANHGNDVPHQHQQQFQFLHPATAAAAATTTHSSFFPTTPSSPSSLRQLSNGNYTAYETVERTTLQDGSTMTDTRQRSFSSSGGGGLGGDANDMLLGSSLFGNDPSSMYPFGNGGGAFQNSPNHSPSLSPMRSYSEQRRISADDANGSVGGGAGNMSFLGARLLSANSPNPPHMLSQTFTTTTMMQNLEGQAMRQHSHSRTIMFQIDRVLAAPAVCRAPPPSLGTALTRQPTTRSSSTWRFLPSSGKCCATCCPMSTKLRPTSAPPHRSRANSAGWQSLHLHRHLHRQRRIPTPRNCPSPRRSSTDARCKGVMRPWRAPFGPRP